MSADPTDDLEAARQRAGMAEVALHSQSNVVRTLARLGIDTVEAEAVMALLNSHVELMRAEEARLGDRAKEYARGLLNSIAGSASSLRDIVSQLKHPS